MTQEYPDRIWFDPPKFWAATRGMTKRETAWLMERVEDMAARKDIEGLKHFSFIYFGNPYRRSSGSSGPRANQA